MNGPQFAATLGAGRRSCDILHVMLQTRDMPRGSPNFHMNPEVFFRYLFSIESWKYTAELDIFIKSCAIPAGVPGVPSAHGWVIPGVICL